MNRIKVLGNIGNGHEAQNVYCPSGLAPTVREMHGKVTKKYFEMFTGIAGFTVGIERAYERHRNYQHESEDAQPSNSEADHAPLCIGFSEIDRIANGILKFRYPNITNYGNASELDTELLPDFDLLCGGFPCQSWSIAGKRRGFDDARGTLFFEIARVLADKRPRHFLLENVKGILSADGGQAVAEIHRILSELGYRVERVVLNSKDHGVPQNRERVFFIGHLAGECQREILSFGEVDSRVNERPKQTTVNTLTAGGHSGGMHSSMTLLQTPETRGLPDGQRVYDSSGLSKTLSSEAVTGVQKDNLLAVERAPLKFPERNGKKVDGEYSFTVDTVNTGGVKVNHQIRRLTPVECARLQGFDDEWADYGLFEKKGKWTVQPISDTGKYKVFGNAVTTNVITAIITRMLEKGCL
jgi:DNA (cytosine-5)-methyltransferase 1